MKILGREHVLCKGDRITVCMDEGPAIYSFSNDKNDQGL